MKHIITYNPDSNGLLFCAVCSCGWAMAGYTVRDLAEHKGEQHMKMNTRYSLYELERMDTICSGQFADMKLDNGEERVWLSRMIMQDGEAYENKVIVDRFAKGVWTQVEEYEAV